MNSTSSALQFAPDRLFVELAQTQDDIREAQALRYQVFGQEMGAKVKGAEQQLDQDEYDRYCHHLLVRESNGRIVGCTRLLTNQIAQKLGGYYSSSEFDLTPILRLPGRLLEIGRTCIHPDYRRGSAIAVLWSGLAGFVTLHHFDYLFGCASIPLGENGLHAEAVLNRLQDQTMAPPELQVTPRYPLQRHLPKNSTVTAPMPPLLKAYLRLGAKVCGEPCVDEDFQVADVLVLLNLDDLSPSYSKHFLDRATQI